MEPKEGISESLPTPEKTGGEVEKGAEAPAHIESAPSRQKPAPLAQIPQNIPSANPVQIPASDDSDGRKAAQPTKFEDKVEEKQWVERAKNIVGQTKDDPFKQNSEMSKVKAEYIKQRFNKTIRTDTSAA